MRAVALSNEDVQRTVMQSFIPLKIVITARVAEFPLAWPALADWQRSWRIMKGDGFTGCSVVSPNLEHEFASTGSALVWEMFDSVAYDVQKFLAMLELSKQRAAEERAIRTDPSLDAEAQRQRLTSFVANLRKARAGEGATQLPPKGFTIEGAKELFRLTGDLKDGQ